MRKFAGMLIGVVLLAAACSGGGGVDTSHDQAKADAAVLQLADVPGFEAATSSSSSSESSSSSDPTDACFQQATGLDPNESDKDKTAEAKAKFKKGSGLDEVGVDADVELHKAGDLLSKQLKAMRTSDVTSCLKDAFQRGKTGSPQFDDVNVTTKDLGGIGDEGLEFDVTARVVGVSVEIEIDYVRSGRAGLSVVVTALGGPTDHDLAVNGLKTMVTRLS